MLSLRLGSVRIRISLLFPAALVILFTLDPGPIAAWCVAAALMHETGHFIAMLAFHSPPRQVDFGVFGMRAFHYPDASLGHGKQAVIALAGPAVNLGCCLLLVSAAGWTDGALVHLILGGFNLIPVEALDGGQALRHALACRYSEEQADRAVLALSVAILIPLAAAGFFLLMQSGYNFTLLVVSLYLGLLLLLKRKC